MAIIRAASSASGYGKSKTSSSCGTSFLFGFGIVPADCSSGLDFAEYRSIDTIERNAEISLMHGKVNPQSQNRKEQIMTGDELKFLRQTFDLSRPALARIIRRHPDTIRYWERKPWLSQEEAVPALILRALDIKAFDLRLFMTNAYYRSLCVRGFPKHLRASAVAHREVLNRPVESEEDKAGKRDRPACGARTRAGGLCRAKVVEGKGRCRMHGGLSTGPKTEAGRRRIAEALQRRRQLLSAT